MASSSFNSDLCFVEQIYMYVHLYSKFIFIKNPPLLKMVGKIINERGNYFLALAAYQGPNSAQLEYSGSTYM